jgi:hypothetical protein
LRRSILACGLLLAFVGIATAAAAATGSTHNKSSTGSTTGTTTTVARTASGTADRRARARAAAHWRRHIQSFRAGTRRWLTVIHGRPPGKARRLLAVQSLGGLRRLAIDWRRREHAAWWRANHPPDFTGWLCIHRYEGSWTDSGGPYWGGLQMDLSFQASYGGWLLRHKGTADHWSPLEQIWVAVRAAHARGFSPWPNTARSCGLM